MDNRCDRRHAAARVQLQHDGEGQGVGGAYGLYPICGGSSKPAVRSEVINEIASQLENWRTSLQDTLNCVSLLKLVYYLRAIIGQSNPSSD